MINENKVKFLFSTTVGVYIYIQLDRLENSFYQILWKILPAKYFKIDTATNILKHEDKETNFHGQIDVKLNVLFLLTMNTYTQMNLGCLENEFSLTFKENFELKFVICFYKQIILYKTPMRIS